MEDDESASLRDGRNSLPELDYERVNRTKQRLLRAAFAQNAAYRRLGPITRRFSTKTARGCCPMRPTARCATSTALTGFSRWGDMARYDRKRVEAYCLRKRDSGLPLLRAVLPPPAGSPRLAATPAGVSS